MAQTIPIRYQDPVSEVAAGPPPTAEPVARHATTFEVDHRGPRKDVYFRLDPVQEKAKRHLSRPERRVMRLRMDSRTATGLPSGDRPLPRDLRAGPRGVGISGLRWSKSARVSGWRARAATTSVRGGPSCWTSRTRRRRRARPPACTRSSAKRSGRVADCDRLAEVKAEAAARHWDLEKATANDPETSEEDAAADRLGDPAADAAHLLAPIPQEGCRIRNLTQVVRERRRPSVWSDALYRGALGRRIEPPENCRQINLWAVRVR